MIMYVRVLFNSAALLEEHSVGWGLSFLIDNKILFDTGEKGDLLINNINKLQVELSLIEAVVFSHDHWDHTGGLEEILTKNPNINVYTCPGFGKDFKQRVAAFPVKLIEAAHFTQVSPGIYSTGEILGIYKGNNISEQALIIKTEKGFSVITGCAHPGIIKILEKIRASLTIEKFYAVFGGFHLKDNSINEINQIVDKFISLKVQKVGATHCSGTNAEECFREAYKEKFLSMNVGDTIRI